MSTEKPKNTDSFEQAITFLNDANGRDKFSKTVQYFARLTAWYYLSADPKSETGLRYKGLFEAVRDARKLPRLLKTGNEVQSFLKLLSTQDPNSLSFIIKLVSRVGWANYWLFDNLSFLNKAKFTKVEGDLGYYANSGWAVGLVCEIVLKANELQNNYNRIKALSRVIKTTQDQQERENSLKERQKLLAARVKGAMELLANLGDLASALNAIKVVQLNEGLVSFLGLVSALIGGYYRWKQL